MLKVIVSLNFTSQLYMNVNFSRCLSLSKSSRANIIPCTSVASKYTSKYLGQTVHIEAVFYIRNTADNLRIQLQK